MQTQIQATLSPQDAKRHIVHRFSVPAGAAQVHIRLQHVDGLENGLSNMLTLTVFDPNGFRGAGHRMGERQGDSRVHRVSIGMHAATPGYIPGVLPAGDWAAIIDVHRVTGAQPCAYSLSIDTSAAEAHIADTTAVPLLKTEGRTAQRQWYRGDLHGHTLHSDGRWHVPELLAWASANKLDFVSLTDHNTVSGLAEWDALSSPEMLTMGGLELTTFYGHALAHGVRQWIDWRVSEPGQRRTMPEIMHDVEAAGGLFVMAHPMAVGDPICTGCSWTYADMMPGPAHIVEVWNGGSWDDNDSHNEHALAQVYNWLNQGYRLVLTSGTDVHGPFAFNTRLGFDVVYADALTERAILEAVRCGHLFLSSGPHLQATAQHANGEAALMGDLIPAGDVRLNVAWRECREGSTVRLVVNGHVVHSCGANTGGELNVSRLFTVGDWFTVEIRDQDGTLAALTNPIFVR